MDQNDNIEYINTLSGGMGYIKAGTEYIKSGVQVGTEYIKSGVQATTELGTRTVQGALFIKCPGPVINDYLELNKNTVPVQQFYGHFVTPTKLNQLTPQQINEISDQINSSLVKRRSLDLFIHKFLNTSSEVTEVPERLDFSPESGYTSYSTLCNLYLNYLSYINSTNRINNLLCQISKPANFVIPIQRASREAGINSTELDSLNNQLLVSLNRLRLGVPNSIDQQVKDFINTNSKYMKVLVEEELSNLNNPDNELNIYRYLIKVAKEFETKVEKISNGSTLLDEYIQTINDYYLRLCDKSIIECKKGDVYGFKNLNPDNLKNLFQNNNMETVNQNFPHLTNIINIINTKNSGSNKFFALYSHVKDFYADTDVNQSTELDVLRKIKKLYVSLEVYNSDILKTNFFSDLFANQNLDIGPFFNESLKQIFAYLKLPTNNLNNLIDQINLDLNKNFFNKTLIETNYSQYLNKFSSRQPNPVLTYLNPDYLIFPNIESRYPKFIENLTNGNLLASDLSININKFIQYVNVFRTTDKQENNSDLTDLFMKLYIQAISPDEQTKINKFVLYNKSLNNRLTKDINYYTTITYAILNQILTSINTTELSKFAKPEFDPLKTDKNLSFTSIPKNLLNKCVVDKTLNKDEISGIKLLIHIVDCEQSDNSKQMNKLIHFYLTLNTQEQNSLRLISWKKLRQILDLLSKGTCTEKQIKTLIQVIELKKIQDPFLSTELNLLKTNLSSVQNQKSVYYLLSALAPEKIEWNINSLAFNYAIEKGGPYIKDILSKFKLGWAANYFLNTASESKESLSISGFKKYVFEKINLGDFIKDKVNSSNSQYKFTCFKIYSYFNFDSVIVSFNTIQKIVKQFDLNRFDEKIFNTLKKILARNSINLEQINRSSSAKLDYFIKNKWNKLSQDNYYISQLYDILKDVADENLFPVNVLDFLKEKGIDVLVSNEINSNEDNAILNEIEYLPIYKMFEAFIDENISGEKDLIIKTLDRLKYGICEDNSDCEINLIIGLINRSEYLKSNEQIKIFIATGKTSNITYASEQELFAILDNLSKSSALIKNVTAQVTQTATDAITSAINTKLQSTALNMGFTTVPEDAITKAKEIAQTAKTIAVTAGIGFATAGAYLAVDKLLGSESSTQTSSLAAYESSDFKSKLKLFIGTVGTGLTIYTARNLVPQVSSLVKDYIEYKSSELSLPLPLISSTIIGSIIMSGLTRYLSKGQAGGGETTLIEEILNWIFDSINKLYGFNGKKPDDSIQSTLSNQTNSIQPSQSQLYLFLTSQKLGSDDIFNSAIINEHPNQELILDELKKRYKEFSNLSINLAKTDKRKIKKLIGKIVDLELNLFKGNEPYTFVNAISKFLNEK